MLGHRGSTDEGWTWSRRPRESRRLRSLLLLGLGGAGVVAVLAVAAIVGFLVLDDGPAGGTTATPTPQTTVAAATATVAATPTATAVPEPTATATQEPTPTPTPLAATLISGGSTFSLAVWDGERWTSEPPDSLSFGEGDAVPFLLRIRNAGAESEYSLTLRRDCEGFEALTSYDREAGVTPALAGPGPGSLRPDSLAAAPGFSLWGGLFTAVGESPPTGNCDDEQRLEMSLLALRANVVLLWGVELADGVAEASGPFGMTVEVAEAGEVSLPLSPAAVHSGR